MPKKLKIPRVIIESPFKGEGDLFLRNLTYAREALLHSLGLGEAPFASHLFYPQVLDDSVEEERGKGIACGLVWAKKCTFVAVYEDLGISTGMEFAIAEHKAKKRTIVYRKIRG